MRPELDSEAPDRRTTSGSLQRREAMSTNHQEILDKLRELRAAYADAHRRGMERLESRDLDGFGEVLKEESRLIEEQALLINRLRSQVVG